VAPGDPGSLAALRAALAGQLVLAGDPGYHAGRAVWNGRIDRHPVAIARCDGVRDVLVALEHARDHGLPVSVRAGGHDVAGRGVCDGGLLVDLQGMRGVRVDPRRRLARAQGGVTWGRLERETQAFGLAPVAGQCSTTGVAGVTLAGGFGWLSRLHGLTIDNLASVDLVTADGRLVTASEDEEPELFWALRGAGANFGIATEIELHLHPIDRVSMAFVFHPLELLRDLLDLLDELCADAPDERMSGVIVLSGSALKALGASLGDRPLACLIAVHAGTGAAADEMVRQVREHAPPLLDLSGELPYLTLQSLFDEAAPFGLRQYQKSEYLSELSRPIVDALVEHTRELPTDLSIVEIIHLGGAMARVEAGATAFGARDAAFFLNLNPVWTHERDDGRCMEWARTLWSELRPHVSGRTYLPFTDEDEGEERVRASFGEEGFRRLVALKRVWDPVNVFRSNRNVPPGGE
jgi:FAD/FMN-containing dehydrogenase